MKFIIRFLFGFLMFAMPFTGFAQDSCKKSCVLNSECGIGGVCQQSVCAYQATYCNDERWSVNARGETRDCSEYRCDTNTGLCLREAADPQDCLFGYVFDGFKNCLPSVQCNTSDPSCLALLERWKVARTEYESTMPEPTPAPLSCVACKIDNECVSSQMCWNGRCTDSKSYCLKEASGSFSQVNNTNKISCGNFSCESVAGLCLNSCNGDKDCINGSKCLNRLCQ